MNITYTTCELCPRMCRIDRASSTGYCRLSSGLKAARAALHHWEEPCISGTRGSGAVFFCGCTLRCCFCQNYQISSGGFGKEITSGQLSDIFLRLEEQGAHNINLVTPTQFLPDVLKALDAVRHRLSIPVVYNCGGYERVETVTALRDYIDIWLPDLKYRDSGLSARYSNAGDYFSVASAAIRQMTAQTGPPVFFPPENDTAAPLLRSGVLLRHMVLPGAKDDSIRLLHWMKEALPEGGFLVSLLSQYTPCYRSREYPEINRRITSYEYDKVVDTAIRLGLTQGFMQKKSSAREEYTPPFDLEGIEEL